MLCQPGTLNIVEIAHDKIRTDITLDPIIGGVYHIGAYITTDVVGESDKRKR